MQLWHQALAAVKPPKHLLVPLSGNADEKRMLRPQALLGDSLPRTAVIRELLTLLPTSHQNVGCISKTLSVAVNNRVFSDCAVDVLVVPGIDITAEDLESSNERGRSTVVESAVAMVHDRKGTKPVQELAREFIRVTKESRKE